MSNQQNDIINEDRAEYMAELQADMENDAMDNAKRCDCGGWMQLTTESTAEHKIVTIYICQDCGATEEEI